VTETGGALAGNFRIKPLIIRWWPVAFFLIGISTASAQNPGVASLSIDHITATTFRVKVNAYGKFHGLRIAYSVAPSDYTQPNSVGNPVGLDELYNFPGNINTPNRRYVDVSGKQPDTVYKVGPQVSPDNTTWYGGPSRTIQDFLRRAAAFPFPTERPK
jgi:hypothetical protein